jgi:L-threonylcarbamoyladenylate synthase
LKRRETDWWRLVAPLEIESLRGREEIKQAVRLLRGGGLVAFPTETVYGLGADATSEAAVADIFTAKGRPPDNPLIVHLGQIEQVEQWVRVISPVAETLLYHFCPGPLTLVLPHRGNLAPSVTAGLSTVAVRVPDHPVALALLQLAQIPVAAPSANRSGRPSPTEAGHVWTDLAGRIDLVLDGGRTDVGIESTVIDLTEEVPMLLRPGAISWEQLQQVVPDIKIDPGLIYSPSPPRSPGMKYRHYAPKAEMWLIEGELKKAHAHMLKIARTAATEGRRVGILTTAEFVPLFHDEVVLSCGERSDAIGIARNLYQTLRQLDDEQVDLILATTFPETGMYRAVMNRLRKAAAGKVIRVV